MGVLRNLVLDAVSSPLTEVMHARAPDHCFGWWKGKACACVGSPRWS